jgi:hypothetical protein
MNKLLSAVIVHWNLGFVAHLRYANSRDDVNISSNSRYVLDSLVDRHVLRVTK